MITLTIDAKPGTITTTPVGALPGGYRLQVAYGPNVTFAGTHVGKKGTASFAGNVIAGGDWLFLRDDGVAIFDTKLTFLTKPDPLAKLDSHVFEGAIFGRAILANVGWAQPIATLDAWKALRGRLQVVLPMVFESSKEGIAKPDVSKALAQAGENAAIFADLARSQFVASGSIGIEEGRITSVSLAVSVLQDVAGIAKLVGPSGSSKRDAKRPSVPPTSKNNSDPN